MCFTARTYLLRPSFSSAFRNFVYAVIALLLALSAAAQQFPNAPMLATALDPNGVGTADWNGDGKADLAYVTTGNTPVLHLLLGDGKGGFTPGSDVTLPKGTCTDSAIACRIFTADFAHTGHPGVLLAGNYPNIWGFLYLPGNGDGTFGTPVLTILPQPSNASRLGSYVGFTLAVGDFNGDGNLDVAAPDYYDGQVRIYLGDGKGGFTAGKIVWETRGQSFAVYSADLNHDGKTDLLVLDTNGTLGLSSGVAVYLGDGAGNFTYSQTYPSTIATFLPRWVADINGDGSLDVVGVDGLGNVLAITGSANGTFSAPQTIATGFESLTFQAIVCTANMNGSGIPSLLVSSNEGFDTAVASGSMKYGAVQKRTSGNFGVQVAIADFNSDGAEDVVLGVPGGIQFFYGNKSGLFPDSTLTAAPAGVSILYAGDFNGDGIADVAGPGADGILRTYFGSRSGVFQAPVASSSALSTTVNSIGNAVGDFDGDGHQDILMSNQVLYGLGDGTFTEVPTTTASNGQVADLNKDGKSDLLSITGPLSAAGSNDYYYTLSALLGTGQRGFTPMTTSLGNYLSSAGITTPSLLAVGDLNGDGIPDAALYDPNVSRLEVWLGNGDGSFKAGTQVSLSSSAWTPQGAGGQGSSIGLGFIADLDGDGKADMVFLARELAAVSGQSAVQALVIAYGDGQGGISSTQLIPLSRSYGSVLPMHLAAGTQTGVVLDGGTVLAVLRNLGGRQFSNEDLYTAGTNIGMVAADFNGDALSDLLVTRSSYSPIAESLAFTVLFDQAPSSGNGDAFSNGALTANPSTANYNQPFTLTAVLQPAVSGAATPTGTVSFTTPNLPLGTAPLVGGTATLQVPGITTQQFAPGILPIEAAYSGDSTYASSNLATTVLILNPQYATTTTLALSSGGNAVTSIQAGSFLTLTATVQAPIAIPLGTIAFYDGGTVLGQAGIASGGASFTTNLLVPGSHSLSARYMGFAPTSPSLGTSNFLPSSSAATVLAVTSLPTATTLNASSPTVTTGAVLTLNAQVTSSSATPHGGVTFLDGATVLGSYSLDASGKASFSTASLTTGSHSFTAQYALNSPWAASSSTMVPVRAQGAAITLAATTTLIAAVTPVSDSSLLATVQVSGVPLALGTVTLLLDGQAVATVPFASGGVVTVRLRVDGAALHNLVASYSGSAVAAPSASPQLQTTSYLPGQDFTLQAAQYQASIPSSSPSSAITLLVGSVSGWSGAATLGCTTGLPRGYSCVFSPGTTVGPGAVTLTLVPPSGAPALGLLLLPGLWLVCRRGRRRAWLAAVLLASLTMLSACGSGSGRESAHSWVVTVVATSGTTLHSTQIEFRSASAR